MASTTAPGLTRVTVVAPRGRIDLAIPTDLPVAHLLPTLLRYSGDELADTGAAQGGWTLSRLGAAPLDSGRTVGQHDIRDGEVLYFTLRSNAVPEVVFDDVADALAVATQDRAGQWTLASTRRTSIVIASAALLGGAAALLFIGPPQVIGGAVGLAMALMLVVTATILSRFGRLPRAAILFALVAVCYAGVGGLLLLGGERTLTELDAEHVLVGATSWTIFAAVLTVLMGTATPLLLGATAAGAILGLSAGVSIMFGTSPAGVAAIVAAIALACVPLLPMLASRLARVPIPAVPTGPEDLKADEEVLDGTLLRARADRADGFLTALIGSTAAILLGAEIVLALTGGLPGLVFCAVLGTVLMLRARPFASRQPRLAVLGAGAIGLGLVAVGLYLGSDSLIRLTVVLGGLVVIAIISLGYGLGVAGKRIAPIWGRFLDIFEIILIVGAIPLAVWVSGLYAWIRAIKA
jgi:type VII secretion integral membrane protein EccD